MGEAGAVIRPVRACWILIVASAALSCQAPASRPTGPEPLIPRRSNDFEAAERAYLLGDYDRATLLFESFLARNPRSPNLPEAYLYMGLAHQKEKRGSQAVSCFDIAAQTGSPAIAARANLQLGYLALRSQSYDAAIRFFTEARNSAVDLETRSEASLELGISLQKSGRFEKAVGALEPVARSSTVPDYTRMARLRLQYDPFFSVQIGAFAAEKNAREEVARLAELGYESEVRAPGEWGGYYRVICGRFDRRHDAESHRQRILSNGVSEGAMVVP